MIKDLEREELNILKQKSPLSLPDNPSDKGLSALQIKSKFYEGLFALFNWESETRRELIKDINALEEYKKLVAQKQIEVDSKLSTYATKAEESSREANFRLGLKNGTIPVASYYDGTSIGSIKSILDRITSIEKEGLKAKSILVVDSYYDNASSTLNSEGLNSVDNFMLNGGAGLSLNNKVYFTLDNVNFVCVDFPNVETLTIDKSNGKVTLVVEPLTNIKANEATTNSDLILTSLTINNKKYRIENDFIKTSEKGAKNGIASLDEKGKVPSSQLPSYVDDVLEFDTKANFPSSGEAGKIYIDKKTNITYRWSGSLYSAIGSDLALGETSSTAYYGDKGKKNAEDIALLKTSKQDTISSTNKLPYANVSGTPTKLSNFTNDLGFVNSTQLNAKQDKLVSNTNIKTINNQSILGSGNIDIQIEYATTQEITNLFSKLISFTIQGVSYQAEEGMTWKEWCGSKYNTSGYIINFSQISDHESVNSIVKDNVFVAPTDIIIANQAYTLVSDNAGGGIGGR